MQPDDVERSDPIDILLVEPNPGDTRLFTEQFKDAKIMNTVHAVSDGEAALDYLHQRGEYADESRPDIILLEPQLPGTSGQDVLAELEEEPTLREIPVAVLTSSAAEQEIVESSGIDTHTYIQKPVEPAEFVDLVQSVEDFWLAIVQRAQEA
ncbi:response regulator [Halobacteria archaeon AArc-dxtr1]|nr:response regulator [Halobacteria archaeon AArc-dxtr1]